MASSIKATAEGKSDVGRVRSANQDAFLIDPAENLYVVADGMGGHAGGEIASRLCIEEILAYLKDNGEALKGGNGQDHPEVKIANTLANSVNYASTKIYERALENPTLKGMGTTATVVKIIDGYAYCAHVGDSRLYLLRSEFLYQITNDHSLVSEQVRAGLLTKEEAELHHLRNVITRSVGYQEEEDVDTTGITLEDGDLLVICSDGLHGKMSDCEISGLVNKDGTGAVTGLIALANERGGDDNITVVIIKIKVS